LEQLSIVYRFVVILTEEVKTKETCLSYFLSDRVEGSLNGTGLNKRLF